MTASRARGPLPRSRAALLLAALALTSRCDRPSTPEAATALRPDAARAPSVADAASAPPAGLRAPAEAVDPGTFERNGCRTDASPPNMVLGTATVAFLARDGQGFRYRNVPARCGAAYPGQLVEGARTRPGDGAEFVVCMPDNRRLDVGVLRRGPVPAGEQNVAQLANPIRLQVGYNLYATMPTPVPAPAGAEGTPQLSFGPRLRSARGRAAVGLPGGAGIAGVVDFEIRCDGAR